MNKNLNLLLEGKIYPYYWRYVEDSKNRYEIYKYEFEDDELGFKYLVEFKNKKILHEGVEKLSRTYELSYYVFDDYKQEYSVSILTGHNIWRVVKTVFGAILTDFLTKRCAICNKLIIEGLSKNLEKSYQSQRTRVYLRFLVRNPIPRFKLESNGNTITLNKTP